MAIDEAAKGSIPLIEGFDYESYPALRTDLWRGWDEIRRDHRFFRADFGPDPVWVLTRYEDVHEAFQSPDLFSNEAVQVKHAVGEHHWIPLELDPPEHGKFRQLLTPWFAPGAVRALEPRIREWCGELIDRFAARGSCEFVGEFAQLYPTTIFMGIMGLPTERAGQLLDWAHRLMHTPPEQDPDGSLRGEMTSNVMAMLGGVLESRRAEPRDDLVTTIVQAEVDGAPVPEAQALEMCFLLYMAGLDTVAGALGAFFRHLARTPADQQRVRAEPSVVSSAVEELLRAYSIVTTGRLVSRDVEWHGCPMHRGDRVLLPTPSANRDPAEFERPTDVELDRSQNRHLAFGAGPHRCLGSYLARAELVAAIEEWHRRIPEYSIADESQIESHLGGVAGFDRLPLVWA
jgi:cytochrome P450